MGVRATVEERGSDGIEGVRWWVSIDVVCDDHLRCHWILKLPEPHQSPHLPGPRSLNSANALHEVSAMYGPFCKKCHSLREEGAYTRKADKQYKTALIKNTEVIF